MMDDEFYPTYNIDLNEIGKYDNFKNREAPDFCLHGGKGDLRDSYLTVSSEASAEIVEKKSRFIANIRNVTSEKTAVEYLEQLRKRYWDAAHNVYAYNISGDYALQKYSDDGEPSGTAGLPVLEVIRKEQIEDVIVVVTRYFGGTLLGTGGLARAYSRCAKEGLAAAQICRRILCQRFKVSIDYANLGRIQNTVDDKGYNISKVDYSDKVDIDIEIPIADKNYFEKLIAEITSGDYILIQADIGYYITREVN